MKEQLKDVFILLAKYNSITNKEVIEVLENIEPDKLIQDLGSYYGSILGLLNHQLHADINWLRTLGEHLSSLEYLLPILGEFPSGRLPPKELHWKNLSIYKPIRIKIDELIEKTIKNLDSSEFYSVFTIEGRRGSFDYTLWRTFLQIFNHHTHHRGGVAVLLDQLGIENSYSNLLWKV